MGYIILLIILISVVYIAYTIYSVDVEDVHSTPTKHFSEVEGIHWEKPTVTKDIKMWIGQTADPKVFYGVKCYNGDNPDHELYGKWYAIHFYENDDGEIESGSIDGLFYGDDAAKLACETHHKEHYGEMYDKDDDDTENT